MWFFCIVVSVVFRFFCTGCRFCRVIDSTDFSVLLFLRFFLRHFCIVFVSVGFTELLLLFSVGSCVFVDSDDFSVLLFLLILLTLHCFCLLLGFLCYFSYLRGFVVCVFVDSVDFSALFSLLRRVFCVVSFTDFLRHCFCWFFWVVISTVFTSVLTFLRCFWFWWFFCWIVVVFCWLFPAVTVASVGSSAL